MNDTTLIGFAWTVFAASLAASLLLPRVAARGTEGLAAGATATLVFLVLFGIACVTALYLAILVARRRARLSVALRTAGGVPIGICLLCLTAFALLMRSRSAPPESAAKHPQITSLPAAEL